MAVMAKDKPRKPYPSRKGVKYIPLPLALWQRLKDIAAKDDRSVSYMGRRAVREFVERTESGSD